MGGSPISVRPPFDCAQDAEVQVIVRRLDHPGAERQLGASGHYFFEILFFEEGRGHHVVGGQRWPVRAGELVLLAPGEAHDPRELSRARGWIAAFRGEVLDPRRSEFSFFLPRPLDPIWLPFTRFAGACGCRILLPQQQHRAWSRRFETLEHELVARQLGYVQAVRAQLTSLLVDAARLVAGRRLVVRPLDESVYAVLDLIDRDFRRRDLSLATIAQIVGRSPAYLTSLVRRDTGQPIIKWLTERRLAEARRLLLETREPIERIADWIGYADTTHFIRQFRRRHGVTPAAWRRSSSLRT